MIPDGSISHSLNERQGGKGVSDRCTIRGAEPSVRRPRSCLAFLDPCEPTTERRRGDLANSFNQRCVSCCAQFGFGHTLGKFDDFEAACDHIQHTEVGYNAVHYPFSGQRQGAGFENL